MNQNSQILEQAVSAVDITQRNRVPNAIRTQWAALGWKAIDEIRKRDFKDMSTKDLLAIADIASRYTLRQELVITPDLDVAKAELGQVKP